MGAMNVHLTTGEPPVHLAGVDNFIVDNGDLWVHRGEAGRAVFARGQWAYLVEEEEE